MHRDGAALIFPVDIIDGQLVDHLGCGRAEAFLEETSKTIPKFKDWLREKKKKGEGNLSDEQQYVQNGE